MQECAWVSVVSRAGCRLYAPTKIIGLFKMSENRFLRDLPTVFLCVYSLLPSSSFVFHFDCQQSCTNKNHRKIWKKTDFSQDFCQCRWPTKLSHPLVYSPLSVNRGELWSEECMIPLLVFHCVVSMYKWLTYYSYGWKCYSYSTVKMKTKFTPLDIFFWDSYQWNMSNSFEHTHLNEITYAALYLFLPRQIKSCV